MKDYLLQLAQHVYQTVKSTKGVLKNRIVNGYSEAGDAQFNIDTVAENAVVDFVLKHDVNVGLYTEDNGYIGKGEKPEYILLVDPIDGTRPAAAGLEMSCISIALARNNGNPKIDDIQFALLKELKTGNVLYTDHTMPGIYAQGYCSEIPNLSKINALKNMFWSIEFNGHPSKLMTDAYGHLVDLSANNGGIFVFNSASYSISRIITGQLDAYVDIGNRLLKDEPELLENFQAVGNGKVLHLFPYDIAASVILAEKAGVIITDAYGNSLRETYLMDLSYTNQQSCIAASNKELHQQIMDCIKWRK